MLRASPRISLREHLERDRRAGLEDVQALHHRLVDLRAAVDVVRLDGQQLLEDGRGAVRLERPHLHLAEALAAEARLAAERLLRDQAVGTGRARVHLLVDEVVQLQHVHDADGDLLLEGLAGAAVVERRTCRLVGSPASVSSASISLLARAVEGRRVARGCRACLAAQPRCVSRICPTFMRLGTPERIQHDVDRRAVLEERHVLDRAGSWRSRPCCRGGRPSCRRPRGCAWSRRRP